MKASELAEIINAELKGEDIDVCCVSPYDNIAEGSLVPLLEKKIPEDVYSSKNCLFLVKKDFDTSQCVSSLVAEDAELALVAAVNAIYPPKKKELGVHANAYVSNSAILAEDISVGAFAVIEDGAEIGRGTQVYPGAVIGEGVKIGENCIIYSNVSIYDGCTLGDRVIIHSGTVIGSDGFGYYQKMGTNVKIPHIASVVIENDVEIGSNSCVDRGKFSDTVVGEGTKIDNQVQVAHNVVMGKHNIMAGQSAIAGSSRTGDYVMVGARAGIGDHVSVCSKVMLAAGTGAIFDIDKPGIYGGAPATTRKGWMREIALVRDLPNIVKRISELEKNK
ncbi:MAG: UDP-3-O-(3-hydroxymyristoyl)glucosamine N-acyltransferase [Denitrovibrio sp.]|nr:MAG: UDP-3-O-(3-hydroxymyristoyl)glucosamine N-acyltransferase [Denitrovibrio sp.]